MVGGIKYKKESECLRCDIIVSKFNVANQLELD